MNTPETCPKCGDPLKDGWDNVYQCGSAFYTEGPLAGRIREHYECIRLQRDQLAAKLAALESAFAECAEKLYHAEQREHVLKSRLKYYTGQRDQLAERVKRLESVVTDPHALWSNWLRGDIQLPAGIGDIRECSEKMKRFRSRWLAAHQELRRTEDMVERAEERIGNLEASLHECAEWIRTTAESGDAGQFKATDVECYQRAVNLLKP